MNHQTIESETIEAMCSKKKDERVASPIKENGNGAKSPTRKAAPQFTPPVIHNILSTCNVGVKLDLRKVASARNTEYNPKRFNPVIMRIKEPRTTALIFSSGKLVVSGSKTKAESYRATRKFAKLVKKTGYEDAKFKGFMIHNVVGSFKLGFYVNLPDFHKAHFPVCQYETAVFQALTYFLPKPKVTMQISGNGSVTILGAKTPQDVYDGFNHISLTLKPFAK